MDILSLFAAFGIGGLTVKAFDLIYIQPYLEKREIRCWLRDKKLMAYSKIAANFQSMGLDSDEESLFKDLALISEAQMLSDEQLSKDLEQFIEKRYQMFKEEDAGRGSQLFAEVLEDKKKILIKLKQCLRQSKV